jgi:hypothetical protein
MITLGRILWRSTLPVACVVVLLVSAWSWRVQPEQTQIGFARVPGGNQASVIISAPSELAGGGTPAWRMHLRLERGIKAPGPAWTLFEGEQLGTGYELHWDPLRLALTVQRSLPPLVLGAASLDHMPTHIAFIRHGFRLSILVDDKPLLELIDPQTTKSARAWGFQATGAVEGSTLSIIDEPQALNVRSRRALMGDSEALDALSAILADPTADDHALFLTQQALNYAPEKNYSERRRALQNAQVAITAFTQDDATRLALQHWINWGTLYSTMMRSDIDSADIAEQALSDFTAAAHIHPTPTMCGLTMHLLDRLVQRSARPSGKAPENVLKWRRQWLTMVSDAATLALQHAATGLSDDWRWQLKLLRHAARCLCGFAGEPTPVAAPEWVSTRWRAFAGANPSVTNFPALPIASIERSPMRAALDQVTQLAAFDFGGLAAVSLRANVMNTLFAPPPANAVQEIIRKQQEQNRAQTQRLLRNTDTPTREVILTRAILALNQVGEVGGEVDEVIALLDHDPHHKLPNEDGSIPLARRDPLAYALYRLLLKRTQSEKKAASQDPFAQPISLPSSMPTSYARLLSGRIESLHEIAWIPDPNVIPAAQALAAGLAMQDVLSDTRVDSENSASVAVNPNWSLLEQVPCFTLPLHLLIPGALPAIQQPSGLPVVP